MKPKVKNLIAIIICTAIILLLWAFYTLLITLLIPDISIRSKLSMAVAFAIPTVITLAIAAKSKKAKA